MEQVLEKDLPYLEQITTQDTPPLSKTFAYLVQIASRVTKPNWLSDLYHDAQWMEKHITGPDVFFFGVREMGTDIGTDYELVSRYNDEVYVVVLSKPKGWWTLTIGKPNDEMVTRTASEIRKSLDQMGSQEGKAYDAHRD